MSLVSIIIPYFKKKNYINKTIQSVLNQSSKNFEIIIIYDDTNLDDLKYLRKKYKKNKKIKIWKNKKNLGAGLSRNIGMNIAKGEYIAFIDSDDLWTKEKLKKQISFMKKNNCDISHTSYKIIDYKGKSIGKRIAKDFYDRKELLKSCDIGLSTVILKKKLLSSNIKFPNIKTKEDFVLWLKILHLGIPILSINQTLSSWRKLDYSLSSSSLQKILDAYKVYKIFMKFNYIKSLYYVLILSLNFLKKNI